MCEAGPHIRGGRVGVQIVDEGSGTRGPDDAVERRSGHDESVGNGDVQPATELAETSRFFAHQVHVLAPGPTEVQAQRTRMHRGVHPLRRQNSLPYPTEGLFQRGMPARRDPRKILNHRVHGFGQLGVEPAQVLAVDGIRPAEPFLGIRHEPQDPVVLLDQVTEPPDAQAQLRDGAWPSRPEHPLDQAKHARPPDSFISPGADRGAVTRAVARSAAREQIAVGLVQGEAETPFEECPGSAHGL